MISLSDGGQLAYVSFEWLTPERNSIAKVGITPDILADDNLSPDLVSLEGQGTPGQTIEISVDGVVVGSTMVDDEGNFDFVSAGPNRNYSNVQGEAIVNLETDNALQVAYETLLMELAASN